MEGGLGAQGAKEGGGAFEEFLLSALEGHNMLLFLRRVACLVMSVTRRWSSRVLFFNQPH